MQLHSQTVVAITGASSGLGAALALELASRGVSLAICARRADRLADVAARAREYGVNVFEQVCDLSEEDQARDFIRECLRHYGRLDVLINNAGRGNCASVEHTTSERLQSIFSLNVFSLWYTTAEALSYMRTVHKGRIVCIASVAAKIGYPFNSAYVAAKHAVAGFVASLRAELAGSGIQASLVCPAAVDTEWQQASEDASIGDLFAQGIRRSRRIAADLGVPRAPLGKLMSAELAAQRIIQSIEQDEADDVYTHDDSIELVLRCAEHRELYDQAMLPLFLGMQEAYSPDIQNSENA